MFHINYCGYNVQNQDKDIIDRPSGTGDYLLLYFIAPMQIHLGSQVITAPSDSFLLYPPDQPQKYYSLAKFINSYIHFTVSDNFLAELSIPVLTIFTLSNPSVINNYIKNLQREFFSNEPYSELIMDAFMRCIFSTIARELVQLKKPFEMNPLLKEQFQTARFEILSNIENDWSTESMASLVHMGKTQFFKYYRLFYRTTPKSELLQARIEKAKLYLCNNAYQINQVAVLTGFQNVSHFDRYFKKICGCTPKEYQKKYF